MAHNVETMAYAGETPWHKLGTYVGDNDITDAGDMMRLAGMDWELALQRTFFATGSRSDGGQLVELKGNRTIARVSDGTPYGIVTPRYKIHQNHEIFKFADELVADGSIAYHTAGSLNNGKNVWVLAKVGSHEVVPGDSVDRFLLLYSSHDGSGATRVLFTEVRVVCANTANAALSHGKKDGISIRHTSKLSTQVDKARDALGIADNVFERSAEFSRELAQHRMDSNTWDMFKNALHPNRKGTRKDKSGNDVSVSNGHKESARNLLDTMLANGRGQQIHIEKGLQVRDTLWGARNALTEALNYHSRVRNAPMAADKASRRFESAMVGNNANIIAKADEILVEMLNGTFSPQEVQTEAVAAEDFMASL